MKAIIKKAVYRYLDSLKVPQKISGWRLQEIISEKVCWNVYPTVVLKVAKHWAFMTGGIFRCIDRQNSIYEFSPGNEKAIGSAYENRPVESNVKYYDEICRWGKNNV